MAHRSRARRVLRPSSIPVLIRVSLIVWAGSGLSLAHANANATAIATNGSFSLVGSDQAGVTLEYVAEPPVYRDRDTPLGRFQSIEIAGHGNEVALGKPALPVAGVGIAIPEGVGTRLSWEVLESSEKPGIRPLPSFEGPLNDPALLDPALLDPALPHPALDRALVPASRARLDAAIYNASTPWPAEPVTLVEMGHLRHHRIGQVAVCPVRFDPVTSSVTVISRLRIRVDFISESGALSAGSSLPRIPVGEEKAWEDTYNKSLLNYEAARSFRTRPLPVAADPLRSVDPRRLDPRSPLEARPGVAPLSAGGANSEFRIYVGKSGLYYVSYADLAAQGWPADVPLDQVHLYEKSLNAADPASPLIRDIPIQVEEAGTPDGLWNGDDYFYFYGLNFEDRFQPAFAEARFTSLHVYWLSRGDGPARIPTAPGWYDAPSVTTPVSYVHETHWEEEIRYVYIRPVIGEYEFVPSLDTHYWLDAGSYRDSLVFSTPGRDASRPCRLRATWQGVFLSTHYVSLWLTRGHIGVVSDTLLLWQQAFPSQQTYTYDSGLSIPGDRLADGDNRLKLQGNGFAPGDPTSQGSGAYFDAFDVDYYRYYVARAGILRFTSAAARGDVEFAIRGLSVPDLVMYDVTDSLGPVRVAIDSTQVTQISGPPRREYELRFRAAVERQRTWVLYSVDAIPPVTQAVAAGKMPPDLGTSNIQANRPADILSDSGADVIVIAHPTLQAALEPWKARRESAPYNHRVRVVAPQDIWDLFSGGHKSPPAIRAWLRHIYRNWAAAPDDLLLFGDASEDYRRLVYSADADWVPTMMLYGPVHGPDARLELVGSDNYYVGALGPSDADTDVFPDMHVGRLSVGSPAEAEAVVAKLLAYDTYSPDDAWRNRGLIVSDDRYSTPVTSNGRYAFSPGEEEFAGGADSLATVFNRESCYTGFQCEQFRLEDVLDAAPCNLGRTYQLSNYPDLSTTIDCAKRYASPAWVSQASRGHLFQIYSGHGNRFVMATERFVEFTGSFVSSDYRTPELLTNYGKPFIYFGVGCHLNEFESFQEVETKASLGEMMVLLPGRGAIASFASTAYEFVTTNYWVEVYAGKTLFSDHPVDPVEGPRRILGEGLDEGLVRLALEKGAGVGMDNVFRNCLMTYGLLGDPTLRIDMAPPRLQVTVDGRPVAPGDNVLPPPGATSIVIQARLSDDVNYRADLFSIEENGVTVPRENYTITPVDPDGKGACRGALVDYTTGLEASRYPIVLAARDWLGREISFTLNLRMDVGYFCNGKRLLPGEIVPVDAPLEVRVQSATPLLPGDLVVRLNGREDAFTATGEGGDWRATTSGELPEGNLLLETYVRDQPVGRISIEARKATILTDVYFYPSPWEGRGAGRFMYQLSYPAGEIPRKLMVTVFSVSGRKVKNLEGSLATGRNIIDWDMKDSESSDLANGVYLFKVALETSSGGRLSTVDRLVVHR